MKTKHTQRIVVFYWLLFSFFLVKSGQAQTAEKLPQTISALEVGMYPIVGPSPAMKISFNNTTGGAVRVMIREQNGTVVYDQREYTAQHRRRFNVAELPAGHYKVELSKGSNRYTQTFVIEPPIDKRVALEDSEVPVLDKKLLANQRAY